VATVAFTSDDISSDTFWAGINAYHASTPSYTAVGAFALAGYTTKFFQMKPLAFPNLTITAVAQLVQPLLSSLSSLGINYTHELATYPGFLSTSRSIAELEDYGVGLWHFGGRLLPGSLWNDAQSFSKMIRVIRDIIEDGGMAFDVAVKPSLRVAGNPDNAVLPAWREAERLFIPMLYAARLLVPRIQANDLIRDWDDYASWDEILQARDKITWTFGEPLRQLSPDSGAYLNEVNLRCRRK
jgi:hypothetical protein